MSKDFHCEYCSEYPGNIQYSICRGRPFCHVCGSKMKWNDLDNRFECECNEDGSDDE